MPAFTEKRHPTGRVADGGHGGRTDGSRSAGRQRLRPGPRARIRRRAGAARSATPRRTSSHRSTNCSGQRPRCPRCPARALIADTPEHDWTAASKLIFPALRPAGTQAHRRRPRRQAAPGRHSRHHSQPLVDEGPSGSPVVYALQSGGFDVIVNADHVLSWGVSAEAIQDAAMENLTAWSARAAWTDEVAGERRLLVGHRRRLGRPRILLPEVIDRLRASSARRGRVLIGLPERDLLIAGTLRPGDEDFASLFAEFVANNRRRGRADRPTGVRAVRRPALEFAGTPTPA